MYRNRRLNFTSSIGLCIILILTLFISFGAYVWSEQQIDAANRQRFESRLLIDELRQSSDDLTHMVRSYIDTRDPAYIEYFQDILAIRDGTRQKPQAHHTAYWDYITAGKARESLAQLPPRALLEEMKAAGFAEQEMMYLQQAMQKSAALSAISRQAMDTVHNAAANDYATQEQARALVYGQHYHQLKAEISQLIDQVIDVSDRRTLIAVKQSQQRTQLLSYWLVVLGLLLAILLSYTLKLFYRFLGSDPQTLYRHIVQFGKQDLAFSDASLKAPSDSVMGWLIDSQSRLQNLEQHRLEHEQSLRMTAQVFSCAQEGIVFTDPQGNILDVNQAFSVITGYPREEVIGQNPRVLKSGHHDDAFYAALWQKINSDGFWRGEIWNRKKNGEVYAEILSIVAIYDQEQRLVRFLGMFTDITNLKLYQQKIEHIAYHDPLTQLPNRRLLGDRIDQAIQRSQRSNTPLAVCCLDLDGFKQINDSYGHEAGDTLLIEVANRLQNCVRSADTVARLGGDEFVILLTELKSQEDCEPTLLRTLTDLARPLQLNPEQAVNISGSIGFTIYPIDTADPDTLLRHADQAMYIAKQAGKNRFYRFDINQNKRVNANWSALSRIEKGLKNQEFRLFVQPKLNLNTGEVVGAEALLRWLHPVRGIIPPMEFLPLLSEQDLAVDIGTWVIEEALSILDGWNRQGLTLHLSVNVFARQLRVNTFANHLSESLQRHPEVPPQRLEIEIVESTALDDMSQVSRLITQCKALGVKFSLDDFGTGYSTLTYLKRLNVDTLKIDQSFVQDMLADDNDLAITDGVINLARAFNYHTVAEGVESWEQVAKLKSMGCELAQGYVIARPMPADNLPDWIDQFQMPALNPV